MIRRFLSFFWLLCWLPLAACAVDPKVHEYKLDNGLKVVVKEDHRAPVAVSQVWYKVGSSYEHDGITGISHMLEHMMFKGTEKHGPGEFSRIIAELGGRENAFTGTDYTAYFETLEKSRLPVAFELEADRMRHLKLDEKEFAKEKQVVLEERRMRTDDQPRAKTYEHFMAVAFTNGPYRNPVIGWPADIEALTVADLRQWYRQWYAPNNATLVVVGDVAPERILTWAKKWFGPLEPGEIPPPKPRTEVEQRGERRLTVKVPAKLPYLLMGYKVPVLASLPEDRQWEAYALTVLAGVLDGGESARLATRLVRGRQIAAAAGAGYDLYDRLPTLFLFNGTPAQGHDLDELEQALRQEVRRLQEEPVSAAELERVKTQVTAEAVYERDSMFYQAMQIGLLETNGLGWRRLDEYVDRIQRITAAQVQEVARKYLIADHLTVARLQPLPIKAGQRPPAPAGLGGNHVR
ncbi:zinc protease [Methylomarinovum tepidoasis]|uniref:Zinc protease n=1 Tax=Methylomarinovum tepidoasis TaxID=2840183 RepID=A0AAU9CBP3_9GAMM|nr:pitrilysin family protein [Methylomarinovum sp. IN45]BCX89336.1 zinc protease [Methylomarinovum sp. IN45]